ncbi:NAD(P)/FAD-dependent oxidoreductase [Paraburkholderia phytofirmans]|uniref:NAD(P)/FAD-dependent oxidoreductase n=1 Tax=Paraburkholderia phytofirmans TaxID=261302 RepID=UPI0038BA4B7B
MRKFDVVVVGAGQAGAHVALSLRQDGFQGSIGVIGDEPDLPYERPPLSKAYLDGSIGADKLLLRPASFWEDQNVEMVLNQRVVSVDAQRKAVCCQSGDVFGYQHLVWAAGGRARKLNCPGAELAGVHVVRTRAHTDSLRHELNACDRIVVIGGGYIGLETAAVLRKAGKTVTVLEAQERVLARVTSAAVSAYFDQLHRQHGVVIRTSTQVVALEGNAGRVTSVLLGNEERIDADLVVVGVGLDTEVEPLRQAGAKCSNGVDVDPYCATSLPDVYAIGDCANHANEFADGRRLRLESVQNANDQARVVAAKIAGAPVAYSAVPWFWSNQYDVRLQTVGLNIGYDETVVRGTPEAGAFSVVYLRGGKVVALDCINSPRDFVHGKKLVAKGIRASAEILPGADLAQLAVAAPA